MAILQKQPVPRPKGRPRKGYNANPVLLIDSARLTNEMVQMRMNGASYREIAQKYGVSIKTVFERIHRAIEASYEDVKDSVHAMRALQNMQLEAMINHLWDDILALENDVSLSAIRAKSHIMKTLISVLERQAKLWGLDDKSQVENTPSNLPIFVMVLSETDK
jgi:predicted DNA-binding protein YlxM (UPF0122 family)